MSGIRAVGFRGDVNEGMIQSGDVLMLGETLTPGILTTAGAGTILAAMIASGFVVRTGPVGGVTDTTDTSTNILAALAGNNPNAIIAPGTTFRMRYINKVAQVITFAAGVGVIAGTLGSAVLDVAASQVRDFLITILNASPAVTMQANTTNASAVVTFVLQPGQVAIPFNVAGNPGGNPTPGMTVSGTGITAGTTVLGITQGQGGITGVTLSANATATSASGGVALTFLPTIRFDGLGSMTL